MRVSTDAPTGRLRHMALRPAVLLKRSLIFVHRWLGVALSLLFLLWFVSGIVMMYWSFPGRRRAAIGLQRAPDAGARTHRLSAEQAFAALGPRQRLRRRFVSTTFDGRPVYRFAAGGGRGRGGGAVPAPTRVFADDGTQVGEVDDAMVDRAASRWAGRPLAEAAKDARSKKSISGRSAAPAADSGRSTSTPGPTASRCTSAARTAEVVQYTTTSSRFWAYLGAIPHWLYFTPLRKHRPRVVLVRRLVVARSGPSRRCWAW